jgi:hypothetical protein
MVQMGSNSQPVWAAWPQNMHRGGAVRAAINLAPIAAKWSRITVRR